jgi:hypothetical protein
LPNLYYSPSIRCSSDSGGGCGCMCARGHSRAAVEKPNKIDERGGGHHRRCSFFVYASQSYRTSNQQSTPLFSLVWLCFVRREKLYHENFAFSCVRVFVFQCAARVLYARKGFWCVCECAGGALVLAAGILHTYKGAAEEVEMMINIRPGEQNSRRKV